jgi:hypothetical protein
LAAGQRGERINRYRRHFKAIIFPRDISHSPVAGGDSREEQEQKW